MTKPVIGYTEYVSLPDFGIDCYAKIDTGACTSSLHADQIEAFKREGKRWVRFHVRFDNHHQSLNQVCEAPVIARRTIASSNGQRSTRYIIRTLLSAAGTTWPIEISLSNRGSMKYPMLIGRKAISGRFLVDVTLTTGPADHDHHSD